MAMSATLRLFGGISLSGVSGEPINLSLRKGEALIAYLAVAPTQRCTRDQLATLLWSDSTASCAQQSLRQTRLSLLRDLSDHNLSILTFDRREVRLESSALKVDAVEFIHLVEAEDQVSLAHAAALYRGDFIDGCEVTSEAFEEWLRPTRAWYRDRAETALFRLIALQDETGNAEAAINTAKRLLTINPLREDVHRWLIRAFMNKGQRSSALGTYEACRAILRRELDVDPEEETTALYKEILSRKALPRDRDRVENPVVSVPRPAIAVRNDMAKPSSADVARKKMPTLTELSGAASQVIQVAAVADGRAVVKNLAYVTDMPPARIEAAMKELHDAGLLRKCEHGTTSIVPEATRSQIVAQLLPSHRRHLHFAVALALEEETTGSVSDDCYDIASHFRAAGNPARAAPYALKSGILEIDRGNLDLARAQFFAVLTDLRQVPMDAERSRLEAESYVLLADLAELRDDLDQADSLLGEAMSTVKRHADPRLLTAIFLAKSRLYCRRGHTDWAYNCIRQAAENARNGTIDDYWLLTERFAYFTTLEVRTSHLPVQALSIARQRVHPAGRLSFEVDIGALKALQDARRRNFSAAYAASMQAIRNAEGLADTTSQIVSLQALGMIQTWDGEPEAALEHFDRAYIQATARGDLLRQYTSRGYRGFALLNVGRWAEALDELREALAMAKKLDLRFMQAMFMAWQAEALVGSGNADEALKVARTAVCLATEWNHPWPHSVALRALAHAVGSAFPSDQKFADRLIRSTALETQTGFGLPFDSDLSLGT